MCFITFYYFIFFSVLDDAACCKSNVKIYTRSRVKGEKYERAKGNIFVCREMNAILNITCVRGKMYLPWRCAKMHIYKYMVGVVEIGGVEGWELR